MLSSMLRFLVQNAMTLLVLAVGLSTPPSVLRAAWEDRLVLARTLLVLLLGVPLVTLLLVKLLPLHVPSAEVIALTAVCPGAAMILRKRGANPVVLVSLLLVAALIPLSVPFWLRIIRSFLGFDFEVRSSTLLQITWLKQLVPLLLGLSLAALKPTLSVRLARVAWILFYVAFGVALVAVLAKGGSLLWSHIATWEALAVLLVAVAAALLGRWAGGQDPEAQEALANEAILGNPALAIAVLTAGRGVHGALTALLAAYVLARAVAAFLVLLAMHQGRRLHPHH
ncbi:MAG: hypothetical protein QM778_03480 [Myxococcales bacterium]